MSNTLIDPHYYNYKLKRLLIIHLKTLHFLQLAALRKEKAVSVREEESEEIKHIKKVLLLQCNLFAPCKRIRNPANFCYWNPEDWNPESTMVWNPESTMVWIPESRKLESGIQRPGSVTSFMPCLHETRLREVNVIH